MLVKKIIDEIGPDIIEMMQLRASQSHRKHGDKSILSGNRDKGFIIACAIEELGEVARVIMEEEGIDREIDEWLDVANVALSAVEVIFRDNHRRA